MQCSFCLEQFFPPTDRHLHPTSSERHPLALLSLKRLNLCLSTLCAALKTLISICNYSFIPSSHICFCTLKARVLTGFCCCYCFFFFFTNISPEFRKPNIQKACNKYLLWQERLPWQFWIVIFHYCIWINFDVGYQIAVPPSPLKSL
jgi:hypothetical protein